MVRIRPARVAPSDEVDAAFDAAWSGAPAFDAAGGVAAGGDAAGGVATATRPSAASVATSKVTCDPSDAPGTGLVQSYFGASFHAPSCAGLNDSAPGASAHA